MKGLLGRPGYVWFWLASTVSAFGDPVTAVALQWLILFTLHGSATDVGLVSAARWLPYALAGIFVGALVDRYRRQPVLVATDVARAALLGAIPFLALAGALRLPVLVAFMVVFGSLSLVNDAAFQSFLPRLVPRPLLAHANARLDQGTSVAQTSGPALAGGLVALIGGPLAVLVDAASYLASGVLLLACRPDEPRSRREPGDRRLWREVAEGLTSIYRHRMLAPLAVSAHIWFLASGALGAVFIPFAAGPLHLGPFGVGVILALAGVGGLLGSLLSVPLGRRLGAGRTVVASHSLDVVAVALVALAGIGTGQEIGWIMLGAGQFLFGFGIGVQNPHEMGYRQAAAPDRLQGRVNATMRSLNRSMIVIGAPLGGLLADHVGFRPTLWLAAAVFLLGAIVLWASPFRRFDHADVAD